MNRSSGRLPEQIRPISFELNVAPHASGSVLVSMGNTRVICGVMIEETVPRWMKEQGVTGGWLTAEYSMLPYSTQTRKPRDIAKGRLDGRSTAPPIRKLVAAVSAGILDGNAIVDLNYEEDKLVTVDFNLVATEDGEFVEVQGSGEEATFAQIQLDAMLALGRKGIAELIAAQRAVLARLMVTPPPS